MTGGKRIIAFGTGGDTPAAGENTSFAADGFARDTSTADGTDSTLAHPDGAWDDEESEWLEVPTALHEWLPPTLAIVAVLLWTVFFVMANVPPPGYVLSSREAAGLIANWVPPVALIVLGWLLVVRNNHREVARFGEAARLLSSESSRLDERLTVVNRELSLAREFLAAQSRDLESLGRIATERLSENADRLQTLIRDNGAQVEAIAGVSTTALDNMERLRGQLPVIASSAKDVANTIGHASRTAQNALNDLVAGFEQLSAAGEASTSRIDGLHDRIEASLSLFDSRLDQVQTLVAARIEALEQRGTQLRERLSADEADCFSAIERRAALLQEEIERTRAELDAHEATAMTGLRARVTALRDEGITLSRAIREGEASALASLMSAKERVEREITQVVERLDRLDRDAIDAATQRIEKLSEEALEFDNRLTERNHNFAEALERRLAEARERHDSEAARLGDLFREFDESLANRMESQSARHQALDNQAQTIAARLETMAERTAAIAAMGSETEQALGKSLAALEERLAGSRTVLADTGATITDISAGAGRLLDLIQASARQSSDDLPAALAHSESVLQEWEARIAGLQTAVSQATGQGEVLARSAADTRATLEATLADIDRLEQGLSNRTGEQAAALAALRESLGAISADSDALTERVSRQLATAIGQLEAATRTVAGNLEQGTASAVSAMAERIGAESAAAIDRAMRLRLAEAVGTLEQAASHAAGVSREATIQLRDQLAKVSELTANLEQRVAHARQRAEEQVDTDFARRVALITESLNSNAIDVAKALSTEVTDTAWAAYLKGDRGVFTRRALRLVDATEQREVTRMYEDDQDFRAHVSRYIHDFEAMLRQLLSTRDGHALGVTLLSSDMGKLYVLLAQSIDRLRT